MKIKDYKTSTYLGIGDAVVDAIHHRIVGTTSSGLWIERHVYTHAKGKYILRNDWPHRFKMLYWLFTQSEVRALLKAIHQFRKEL